MQTRTGAFATHACGACAAAAEPPKPNVGRHAAQDRPATRGNPSSAVMPEYATANVISMGSGLTALLSSRNLLRPPCSGLCWVWPWPICCCRPPAPWASCLPWPHHGQWRPPAHHRLPLGLPTQDSAGKLPFQPHADLRYSHGPLDPLPVHDGPGGVVWLLLRGDPHFSVLYSPGSCQQEELHCIWRS